MGKDSLASATVLTEQGRFASAVSRAYYAVYQCVTGWLIRHGFTVEHRGRANPSHEQLEAMVESNIAPRIARRGPRLQLVQAFQSVRRGRVIADYDPRGAIDERLCRTLVRQARSILFTLGVPL